MHFDYNMHNPTLMDLYHQFVIVQDFLNLQHEEKQFAFESKLQDL